LLDNINWCLIGIIENIDETVRRMSNGNLNFMLAQFREELITELFSKYLVKKDAEGDIIYVGLRPHYLKAFKHIIFKEKGNVLLGGLHVANDGYSGQVSITQKEEQAFIQEFDKEYNALRLVGFVINQIQQGMDALQPDNEGWINTYDEAGRNNINILTKFIEKLYDKPYSQLISNDDGDKVRLKPTIEALVVNGLLKKEIISADITVAPLGMPIETEFEFARDNGAIKQERSYGLCVASFDEDNEKRWCKVTISEENQFGVQSTRFRYLTPSQWIIKQLEKNQLGLISENIHLFNLDEIFHALKNARLNGKFDALLTLIPSAVFSGKIQDANDLKDIFELLPQNKHVEIILNSSSEIIRSILEGPENLQLSFKYKSFYEVYCCWSLMNRKKGDKAYLLDKFNDIAKNSDSCALSRNIFELSKRDDITIAELEPVIQLINKGEHLFSSLVLNCNSNVWKTLKNANILEFLSEEDLLELVKTKHDSSIEVKALITTSLATFPNGIRVLSIINADHNGSFITPEILNYNVDFEPYQNMSLTQALLFHDIGLELLLANEGVLASSISGDTINKSIYVSDKNINVSTLQHLLSRGKGHELLDDDEGRLRKLISEDALNFISEREADKGKAIAFMLLANVGIKVFNAENGRLRKLIDEAALNSVIENGADKGYTLAYKLSYTHEGLQILNAEDGRLRKLVDEASLNSVIEGGPYKGYTLAFELSITHEGLHA